jgi:hypothetical protein
MGTRSLTILNDDDGTEIAVMYRQFDGYPTGIGAELKELLKGKRIVNGFGPDDGGNAFNGGACLAASVVSAFKSGIGNVYLHPAGTRDAGEEFRYTITPSNPIGLKVESGYGEKWNTLYDGPIVGFDPEKVEGAGQ